MEEQDATAAWNLFRFNWLLIAIMSAILSIGVLLTDFHMAPSGYLIAFSVAAPYGVFGYYNAVSPIEEILGSRFRSPPSHSLFLSWR